MAYQQTDAGQSFVFDRRAHAVYAIVGDSAKKIVEVGAEAGRVIDPSAFAIDPADGTFVIADAPLRRQRIQVFTASGSRMAGFTLDAKDVARVTLDSIVLNGVGSIQFNGRSIFINQPETGALVSELSLYGEPVRAFGELRRTGQEDHDVHLALNAGFPLIDPTGGFYFVFNAGVPLFRKYDAKGTLVFERHVEGPEMDEYLRSMPETWPKRRNEDGDVLPVRPARDPRSGRRSRWPPVDFTDGAVHVRVQRARRQDPHGAIQGSRCHPPVEPVLHEGRPPARHARMLRIQDRGTLRRADGGGPPTCHGRQAS